MIQSGRGKLIAVTGDRLPPHPDTPTMTEQGAKGGFYETRAFTRSPCPPARRPTSSRNSPSTLVRPARTEGEAGCSANYLLGQPSDFETTNKRFKRDSEVMLAVLKELGVKPE